MPFTPFHMGPGIFLKAVLQGSFSLMVFGWAQIIMDLQPLIVLLSGEGHLHGFTHTYIGATLIGAVSAVTGKYAAEFGLRKLGATGFLPIGWAVTIFSAFVGAYSHVLLDSLMHADLEPFAPFSQRNPFLNLITIESLHKFCLYSGLIGAGIYFVLVQWLKRRK
ncbi:MAG: metal-dependent hydrolase [Burkholderiales bacterium]|nr:metal-dependent hydrolase [Burkholderiales bacterium]